MNFQVLCARTDVEPFPVIETTPPILPPARSNRAMIGMKEIFRFGGIRSKNFRVPNRDVGEVVIAGHADIGSNIDDPAIAKSDRRG